MVKKADDWRTVTQYINTTTAKRKYLDTCKDWFVQNDALNLTKDSYSNIMPEFDGTAKTHRIGLYDTDTRCVRAFVCTMCGEESSLESGGRKIIANPFTRAQFMLSCYDCASKISSFR